jgi:hypothetical protein
LLLVRIRDQPQQHEEGHHRRDEIGIGDLPRAAVVAAADDLLDAADDDRPDFNREGGFRRHGSGGFQIDAER